MSVEKRQKSNRRVESSRSVVANGASRKQQEGRKEAMERRLSVEAVATTARDWGVGRVGVYGTASPYRMGPSPLFAVPLILFISGGWNVCVSSVATVLSPHAVTEAEGSR